MTRDHEPSEGWKLWHKFSDDEQIKDLPPLSRLITGIRKGSKTKNELINNAYSLCEENIDIIKYEYNQWKGRAIFDATSVFSLDGIGSDLINQYGLSFVDYLRIMGELAKRTERPAQYHQCINTNLYQSNYDDEIIIERMKSLENCNSQDNFTISPKPLATERIANRLLDESDKMKKLGKNKTISIDAQPDYFSCFTRRIRLNFDGEIVIGGPLFMNTYLSEPFAWLVSIRLDDMEELMSHESKFKIAYSTFGNIENASNYNLTLLIDSTSGKQELSCQEEHNFLIYNHSLPIGENNEVTVALKPSQWKSIDGNPNLAYGLKCKISDPQEILQRSNKRLILALKTKPNYCVYEFSMSVPSISM